MDHCREDQEATAASSEGGRAEADHDDRIRDGSCRDEVVRPRKVYAATQRLGQAEVDAEEGRGEGQVRQL